jgi:HAE1 family hydrophobic/amphiphilic exporter-1
VSAAAQEAPQTPPGGVVRPAPGTPDVAKPQDRPAPGTSAAAGRTYPEVVAPPRVGISLMQTRLTLQEAIQMALANNLEIEIEKTNIDNSQQSVQAARGFFDPNFRWVPGYQLTNTPTGSVLQGASGKLTDRNFVNNFAFRWPLPNNGTAVGLTFDNGRSTTTNPFTSFNPTYLSRLAVGFTQPMLRGRTVDPQRAELRIRQKQVDVSQLDFETRVIDVITRVQTAYWNLAAARADTDVNRDVAAQAREQLAINQRLVRAGTLAPVELSAAEAELERRLDSWYASLQVVTLVENELKTLLAKNREADIWRDEIIPSETDIPDIRTGRPMSNIAMLPRKMTTAENR